MSVTYVLTGSFIIIVVIFLAFFIVWNRVRDKRENNLLKDNEKLSKTSFDLLEKVQKTQQSQADQLDSMSKTVLEVSEKMTNLQINLLNIIDSKLKAQSDEFKKDLDKVNNKVDTILGLVMECDNENCPTKRKVSNYLKNHNQQK